MTRRFWAILPTALGVALLLAVRAPAREDQPPPDPTPKDGVDVLARGPVHEGFAEPTDSRPQPSVVSTTQPPAAIDEVPPEQKPEGDGVQWIPGYWQWDDEHKDYLWVSGFWRVPPPNRQWVPGSWRAIDGGWQWTAGFWANNDLKQVDYLPAPPPSVDTGASTPAPDDSSIYTPGIWVYREQKYYWRPGFWVRFQPDWVWIPAHYVWTPGGYIFVEGYWDHPLGQRGLLFAPVRIRPAVIVAGWTYTPYYVVQPDFLIGALFVRPDYCHYFFGDFFEEKYAKRFIPWVDYHIAKGCFDPNFAYYRHRFSGDNTWEHGLRDLYTARFKGEVARPPHTLVQQTTVIKNFGVNRTENVVIQKNINITNIQNVNVLAPVTRINNYRVTSLASLGSPKAELHKIENHVIKTEVVPKAQITTIHQAVTTFRDTADKRHEGEAKILVEGHTPVKVSDTPRAVKIELPKAPTPAVIVERPKVVIKEVPKLPPPPIHEERVIPNHEPPKLPTPPRHEPPKDKGGLR